LFNIYIEELIFSIYSLYFTKLKGYNIASYKYKYINPLERQGLKYNDKIPLKNLNKKDFRLESFVKYLQHDLVIMMEYYKSFEKHLNGINHIEVGENYLQLFIEKIESIRNLTYCSKDDILNYLPNLKGSFNEPQGSVLLEVLLLLRVDIIRNEKDWHKFYINKYFNN
jgi:hypothetical protein